jgi:hypothetical protein
MKSTISYREKIAQGPLFWQDGKPFEPKRLSPTELFPPEPTEEDYTEKAPIGEAGSGAATWAKLSPNLHIKYEVPSFDRGGAINVLVSGKMPFTLGHHIQFNGILESTGIGDIFTMDHELISSLRKFVYQEMPRIDKFSKQILDQIYADTVADVGLNVPIKSIYEYLRSNYPKEFSKATKGKNLAPEQLSEVIRKQREFYGKRKLASISYRTLVAAQFGKKELLSIDFKKLDKASRDALKKYNDRIDTEPVVYMKPKDQMRSIVVVKTNDGVLKAISVPNKVLKKFEAQSDLVDQMKDENEEVYGRDGDGNSKNSEKISKLYAKLNADKKLNEKEVLEVFNSGLLDDLGEEAFMKVLAGTNGTSIYKFYEANKKDLDAPTKTKFITFKVRRGEKLSADEMDVALKSMDKEQMKENPEMAMALIYHKIRNQTPMQVWEVEFLLDGGRFNQQLFEHHERAFVDYYNYALKQNKLDTTSAQLKRVIMEYKRDNKLAFTEAEKQDPVYRELFGSQITPAGEAPAEEIA